MKAASTPPSPLHRFRTFLEDTRREISKVTWPTRPETIQTTTAVVVMALVGGLFFLVVDSGLGYIVRHLLGMASSQ